MDNDDRQVGRLFTRREVLALLGTTGIAAVAALVTKASGLIASEEGEVSAYLPIVAGGNVTPTATNTPTATPTVTSTPPVTPSATATTAPTATITTTPAPLPTCIVRPEATEGPYFVDEMLNRSDIRIDPSDGSIREGALLLLAFNVSQISPNACTWLQGAQVDVWHCDAAGLYSDVAANGTLGKKFLRGYQLTDANGLAQFITIYPGWYSGRTVHIHFKIRLTLPSGESYEFTSQLFFDDELTAQVYTEEPYASRGLPDTSNSEDNIYDDQLLLTVTATNEGYATVFSIGLQLE